MYSVTYGNPKAFTPRWFKPDSSDYFLPYKWNYLYDTTLLKNTLNQYIDFRYLNKIGDLEKNTRNNNTNDWRSRLIITAADIQKGQPVIFDSYKMDIDADSVVACAGYPFYGIQWSTKDDRYLWDGSLLTNTPMLEAINASPEYNKRFYIVDVFPREQKELPINMVEVWHRARDIIFMDKTNTNIEMLKIRERHLSLLKKIHDIINADDAKMDEKSKARNYADGLLSPNLCKIDFSFHVIYQSVRLHSNCLTLPSLHWLEYFNLLIWYIHTYSSMIIWTKFKFLRLVKLPG